MSGGGGNLKSVLLLLTTDAGFKKTQLDRVFNRSGRHDSPI